MAPFTSTPTKGATNTYKPVKLGGNDGGSLNIEKEETPEAGKGAIDLTDPGKTIGDSLQSFAQFGGNVIGGLAGAIGSIGPDGETASIGQLAEDIGRIPGGIGDIKRPWDADDPTAPTLGQAAGMGLGVAGDVVGGPGRFAQERYAEARVLNYQKLGSASNEAGTRGKGLPADLRARLDEGATVDEIADELLARGESISSDPLVQLAGEIVMDPLNLIAPGASKAIGGVRAAGMAVRGGKELAEMGLTERAVGTMYNAASRGFSQAGASIVDKTIGPVTSGVFQALGTKPYQSLISGAGRINKSYAQNFERAFALAAGQLPRAVIGKEMMQDVASKLAVKADDVAGDVERRLQAKLTTHGDEIQRRTEELLDRVTPAFSVIDEAVTDATVRKYAATTGMSPEDAARTLGKVDRDTARTVHLAYYGQAGGDLAELKKVIPSSPKLDVGRLTVIAPDTLTDELADAIVAGDISAADAVDGFSVLGNHFIGKAPSEADVLAFIDKIRDTLPQVVKLPKSGKNALPKELGDWRARNEGFGYDLGFAPKDGWKSIVDEDGNVIMSDPFVHFVSDVDPVTMRNPLGRFMDGLMRGTTQTVIVQQSRERMVDFVTRAGLPISPNQIRGIHKAILETAADRGLSPRALAAERSGGEVIYNEIFRKFLTNDEYDNLTTNYDPTFVVMKAFEGNWKTVGLTQKFTGWAKSRPVGGAIIAKITESLYPKARFTYRPTFQMQESIESPVFNALRGVTDREVPEELLAAYRQLAEQPEFKFLAEANLLNIAGQRVTTQFMGANTKVGRAMGRFANISARKEQLRVRQVMFEHGDDFKEAVQAINPKFWRTMEDAYGTSDPKLIADQFLAERMTLGSGENIDDAMRLVDEATAGAGIQAAYDAGDIAAGQAQNIVEGVRRGGSAASGGAMKAEGALPSNASTMVLQAFKDSFREASNRAFQTHFFNPQRGWLERSLNHPYLGLYPLSYMWGKVLPEFARFLLVRPFGKNAPLVGAANLERVQQAYLGALADDPEFQSYITENEDAIYFANLLFPGNPVNLTVNAPAWARGISEDAAAGRSVTGATVVREIADSAAYATGPAYDATSVVKAGSDLVGIGEDIFANLEKAAAQYDGQFPLSGSPAAP